MREGEKPDEDAAAELAMGLHVLLQARGQTVSTAESLTGGLLSSFLTDAPGASASFVGGVVSYATALKIDLLDVPAALVEEYGAVSAECACEMAAGVRRLTGSTYAVSTTGVAGPAGQEGKPAGTVFVGVAGPAGSRSERLTLPGGRHEVRAAACLAALSVLSAVLEADQETNDAENRAGGPGEESPLR